MFFRAWKRWSIVCFPFLMAACIIFYALKVSLPSIQFPIQFYSTHNHDDLKLVLIHAIKGAQRSIHCRTYALTDLSILSLLKKKARKGVDVHLYYHKKTSPKLILLEDTHFHFHPIQERGLMHEKLWIIDESQIFFGSANMTYSSLKMHENSILGVYSPQLAQALMQPCNTEIIHVIQEQTIHYFSLPNAKALDSLLALLDQAKKRIHLFLFTFTHPKIVEKLVELYTKGIQITLTIDASTSRGASKKAVTTLAKAGIPIYLSQGLQLFHHKWALVDDHTLILGSANWTQSAFNRNRDFILLLYPLKNKQIKYMNKIINNINRVSKMGSFGIH